MNQPDIAGQLGAINTGISGLPAAISQQLIERDRERERLRTIKYIRIPLLIAQGANPFTAGGDNVPSGGQNNSPDQGYVWHVRSLVVEGLSTGATPDVVNITRGGRIVWQLNGNQFAQTWGRGEFWLNAGETLGLQSVGTFAAVGKIIMHGHAEEVAAEMGGKLK